MLNVAMLSKWHVHAPEYARRLSEMDDVKLTVVWDEDPERGAKWAKDLGCDFEPDLDKVLARPDVDAVCIDTPTNMHKEVMLKAAKAKKHIYTEKVMCLNVKDCDEVIKADEKTGHALLCKNIRPDETVTYWFGSCWSKGDLKTAGDWFHVVKSL